MMCLDSSASEGYGHRLSGDQRPGFTIPWSPSQRKSREPKAERTGEVSIPCLDPAGAPQMEQETGVFLWNPHCAEEGGPDWESRNLLLLQLHVPGQVALLLRDLSWILHK